MIPAQVQLTEKQARILERMAAEKEISVAELIRHSKDSDGGGPFDAEREGKRQRALSIIGAFSSDVDDLSVNHDRYLATAYADSDSVV